MVRPLKPGNTHAISLVVWYTAVFRVVTQPSSWEGALRDDSKNGCVADYFSGNQDTGEWISKEICLKPLFYSEAKCESIDTKMIFPGFFFMLIQIFKSLLRKKGFALNLVLKQEFWNLEITYLIGT